MKKNNKVGELTLPDFSILGSYSNQSSVIVDSQSNATEYRARDSHSGGHLIFGKGAKVIQ